MFTTQGLKAIKYRISIMFPGNNSSPPVPQFSNLVFFTYLDTDKIKISQLSIPCNKAQTSNKKSTSCPQARSMIFPLVNVTLQNQEPHIPANTCFLSYYLEFSVWFYMHAYLFQSSGGFVLFVCCFFNLFLSALKRLLENRVSKQTLMFQTTTCNYSVHRRILKS